MDLFPLTTDRLILRPFTSADFSAYAAYHRLKEVYRYLYASPPEGDALQAQFADAMNTKLVSDGDVFRLAVTLADNGCLVGEVMLKLASRSAAQGEIGYIFNPSWAGRGFAAEAVAALVRIGFEEVALHRLFARLDTANAGSVALVERLGFRREAHLIENDRFDGAWGDEFIYAMLRREWAARPRHP